MGLFFSYNHKVAVAKDPEPQTVKPPNPHLLNHKPLTLLCQQLNFKLFGFPYLVGIIEFNPFYRSK